MKLSQDPMCEDPHGDHAARRDTATAKQVHHIKPLRDYPEMAFDWSNLMSVCFKCHDKFNRMERATDQDKPKQPEPEPEQPQTRNRYF